MSPVAFVDLGGVHREIEQELSAAFARVVGHGGFTLGVEVESFEREFSAYCGTPECVGVNSGTAAITIALLAAGIGVGDEVIVPAHTYVASVLGIVHAGATPVFCDVDDTALLAADSAAEVVTEHTAAILAVHLYGQVCDMDAIGSLARRHGIAVFEDAAQAHGATYNGRRAGTFGLAACFSFYPTKNLGALGDGGAICTSDTALAARCRELRNIGQRAKGEHVSLGFNERLDGLQAALLRVKLPHLDAWNEARQRIAGRYREALASTFRMVVERPESPSVHHLFPIRVDGDRAALAQSLAAGGIGTGVHYSPAAHMHPAIQALGAPGAGSFSVAEEWAAQELSLPMWPGLVDVDVERVASALRSHFSGSMNHEALGVADK